MISPDTTQHHFNRKRPHKLGTIAHNQKKTDFTPSRRTARQIMLITRLSSKTIQVNTQSGRRVLSQFLPLCWIAAVACLLAWLVGWLVCSSGSPGSPSSSGILVRLVCFGKMQTSFFWHLSMVGVLCKYVDLESKCNVIVL